MQASKSHGRLARFDTFECLTCETRIVEQPAPTAGGSGCDTGKL